MQPSFHVRGLKCAKGYRQSKIKNCEVGQGELNAFELITNANSLAACSLLCEQRESCMGFDYTLVASPDSCRLYGQNTPQLGDGGPKDRLYCSTSCFDMKKVDVLCMSSILKDKLIPRTA